MFKMFKVVVALAVALVSGAAHAATCTWPTVSIPAAPSFAARTITISPTSTDLAVHYGSYDQALPHSFVSAVRHAEYATRIATRAEAARVAGLIDVKQANDATWLAATTATRAGTPSGQTETAQAIVVNVPVAVTVPIYTELRFTPDAWPYGPLTVSTPRPLHVLHKLREIEYLTRYRGWAFPGSTGELYASGRNLTVAAHIADYYNGYGYPPELLQQIYDLWLPAPSASSC